MEKEFRDIYYKIYNENGISEIEKLSIKSSVNLLKLFGIMMLGAIVFPKTLFITLPALIIYVVKTSSKKEMKKKSEYDAMYKEKLILPLLQEMFEDVQYKQNEGMLLEKYLEAEYNDKYIDELEEYTSNDHIIFPVKIGEKNIGKLDVYDVKLQIDGDDNRKIRLFEGLTGSFLLPKDIGSKIELISNSINLNFINVSKDEDVVPIDMPDFEKYFKLLSKDKILAMRIFTPDIMGEIINIYMDSKDRFDLNIINDRLHIRMHCTSAFETSIVIGGDKYEVVKQDFIALETMKKLVCLIYELIYNL